jgi:Glu-tRNA(Gln) amidotransferase subunit E-like FAD-binding protein
MSEEHLQVTEKLTKEQVNFIIEALHNKKLAKEQVDFIIKVLCDKKHTKEQVFRFYCFAKCLDDSFEAVMSAIYETLTEFSDEETPCS